MDEGFECLFNPEVSSDEAKCPLEPYLTSYSDSLITYSKFLGLVDNETGEHARQERDSTTSCDPSEAQMRDYRSDGTSQSVQLSAWPSIQSCDSLAGSLVFQPADSAYEIAVRRELLDVPPQLNDSRCIDSENTLAQLTERSASTEVSNEIRNFRSLPDIPYRDTNDGFVDDADGPFLPFRHTLLSLDTELPLIPTNVFHAPTENVETDHCASQHSNRHRVLSENTATSSKPSAVQSSRRVVCDLEQTESRRTWAIFRQPLNDASLTSLLSSSRIHSVQGKDNASKSTIKKRSSLLSSPATFNKVCDIYEPPPSSVRSTQSFFPNSVYYDATSYAAYSAFGANGSTVGQQSQGFNPYQVCPSKAPSNATTATAAPASLLVPDVFILPPNDNGHRHQSLSYAQHNSLTDSCMKCVPTSDSQFSENTNSEFLRTGTAPVTTTATETSHCPLPSPPIFPDHSYDVPDPLIMMFQTLQSAGIHLSSENMRLAAIPPNALSPCLLSLIPRNSDGDFLSVGSIHHHIGACRACLFFGQREKKCKNGIRCLFCHFPHTPKPRSRLSKRKRIQRKRQVQAALCLFTREPVPDGLMSAAATVLQDKRTVEYLSQNL